MTAFLFANQATAEDDQFQAFFQRHCFDCHAGESRRGGLDLAQLQFQLDDKASLRRWVSIYDRVARGEMPPASEPRPPKDKVQTVLDRLGPALMDADIRLHPSSLRRLNRVEYEHTVCDLFGIRVSLKEMLPEDPLAYGFDTVAEALTIAPEQMELYLQAADKALEQVFGPARKPPSVDVQLPIGRDPTASRAVGNVFVKTADDSLIAFQDGWCPLVFTSARAPVDGTYRIQVQVKTHQSQKPLVMAIYGGDVTGGKHSTHLVGYFDIAPAESWTVISFEDYLERTGCYQFKPYGLKMGPERFGGPGLMVGQVSVTGPLEPWPPRSKTELLSGIDEQQAGLNEIKTILTRLLPRAYRRQIEPEEIDPFLELAGAALKSGQSFQEALSIGLKAMLCSPEFLLRGLPSAKNDELLAARLSYFLWSSLPDEELLNLAHSGTLHEAGVLHGQVERMLADPKSSRFVENFTGEWLGLRNIRFTEPDAKLYPEFDEMLRNSMVEETRRFFRRILDEDLPILDFIDSDWTFLNASLARHYGTAGVSGSELRQISLPADSLRGGVLTQASVLKITANGTNTSPVVRGVWVLENLLGRPTPPPPGGVPAIEPDIRGTATVREQLNKHREDATCAVCHNRIDPPGIALESFDPIGGQRRWYRTLGAGARVRVKNSKANVSYHMGRAVDSRVRLTDSREFRDVRDVKRWLLEDKPQLARCLAEKLLTYAVGRRPGFADRSGVEQIVAHVEQRNYGFRSLIHEVVLSPMFIGP